MKLVKIWSLPEAYWRLFYLRNFGLECKSYKEQQAALFHDSFGQSDAYSHFFRLAGYECEDIIANVVPLQRAWALENGIQWNEKTYKKEIPIEFSCRYKPDIVFVNDYYTFAHPWAERLRAKCSTVKLITAWCAAPLVSLELLSGFDLILSSSLPMVNRFRKEGLLAEHIRHAFDPRVLERIDMSSTKYCEISFVGSIIRSEDYHLYRAEVLELLVEKFDVRLFSKFVKENSFKHKINECAKKYISSIVTFADKLGFDKVYDLKQLAKINNIIDWRNKMDKMLVDPLYILSEPCVYGLRMYQTLRNSLVTLNVHGDIASSFTGNMRLFEATGVGTCLLTDWKEDLGEIFETDKEVVAFRSIEDCADKLRWLLDNPRICEDISNRGMQRTLRDHTYKNRVEELNGVFIKYIDEK